MIKKKLKTTPYGKNYWRVWVNKSLTGYVRKIVVKQRGISINMYQALSLRNHKLGTPYYTLKSASKRVEQEHK